MLRLAVRSTTGGQKTTGNGDVDGSWRGCWGVAGVVEEESWPSRNLEVEDGDGEEDGGGERKGE